MSIWFSRLVATEKLGLYDATMTITPPQPPVVGGTDHLRRTRQMSNLSVALSVPVVIPIFSGLAALVSYQLYPWSYDYIWGWVINAVSSVFIALPLCVAFIVNALAIRKRRSLGYGTRKDDVRVYVSVGFWLALGLFWIITGLIVMVTNL